MNEAELLYRAADEIDKGWCKALDDGRGNHCAIGAMHLTAFGDARNYGDGRIFGLSRSYGEVHPNRAAFERAEVVLERVMQHYFNSRSDIRHMNDFAARSGSDISTCMRKAADEIRMGDIGTNPRRIEVIPATKPVRQPVPEPAPVEPVKVPEKEPVPA